MQHASRRMLRRLLVILAVVVIVPSGIIGYRWQVRLSQIEQLAAVHGEVFTTHNYPDWMWNLLGDRMRGLEQIESVVFGPFTDAHPPYEEAVSLVANLQVPAVAFWEVQLDPQTAFALANDPELVWLEIEYIRFFGTHGEVLDTESISAQSLSELMKSRSLESLTIRNTELPSNVFSLISNCKSLQELRLEGCEFRGGDAGLFEDLPSLTSLTLTGNFVTDDVLESLSSCPNLKFLAIRESQISDEGLSSLDDLKQLKQIQITDSPVTPQGIAELQAALPDCEISEQAETP